MPFLERVEADSNGEMTYKLYSGGAILGGKNMVEGLRNGVADIGQIVFGYYPAEFPYANLIADMAIYGNFPPAVSAAMTEFNFMHCGGCLEDYKRNGLVVLGTTSTSAYQLIGNEDLSDVETLKGLKIRTPGALWARWVRHVGGVPIATSASEMYEAFSRGQIDAVMQPIGAMRSHSLWDISNKITEINLGTYRSWGVFSVSRLHWAKLTEAQRKILMKNASIGLIGTARGYMKGDDLVREEADKKNLEFFAPSEGLKASVTDFLKSDRAQVIEMAKDKYKIADPEPLMDTLIDLIEKWHGKYEPIQGDDMAMANMLWDEVLSKVDVMALGQ
ncbi:C4-dicarboxylate TRAP transporter substrate-binding protein [Sneathiella chinensis]|uniref:C4-dicarboxylate TRAP transporter substrate-binding protein n=1 Tax=Sneathiella chinensis TaxID=349750 RepID=UPI0024E0B2FB|nr:C4-dicarboxylate TRAP transporter substrate-binding protein [Sneathiella chinensis]